MLIFRGTDRNNAHQEGQVRQNISNANDGRFVVHPLYNETDITNDVGLIHLPQKLQFNEYIKPVKLASNEFFNSYTNSPAVISGWGRIVDGGPSQQHLQYGYVTIMDLNACISAYANEPVRVTQGNICFDPKGGVSSCQGDSGGPCVSTITGELIGFTSFGHYKGCVYGPSVYSRITYYRDWIKQHTGI